MEFDSYIYIFLNPLIPGKFNYGKFTFNFCPFYIGKGINNRLNVHFQNGIINKHSNSNIINGFIWKYKEIDKHKYKESARRRRLK